MNIGYGILIIIGIIIISVTCISVWLWYCDPYYIINWWNGLIKTECDQQDINPLNGIISYHDAWDCPNNTAIQLHQLIHVNHDKILTEVLETIKHYDGFPISEISWVHDKWFKNDDKLHPIWVRFMGDWAGSADRLPTLKHIVSLFPEIPTLHVSIFYPGTTLVERQGPSRTVHRYNYGLKIPYDDVGLKISGFDVKWKEKEGFIWDDTLPHSAWNHTSEPRIVISADIPRDMSFINNIGSQIIYYLAQRTKHVSHIKTCLQQEGIVIH